MPFGDEKVTQFSGFPPTSVSYLDPLSIYVVFYVVLSKSVTFTKAIQGVELKFGTKGHF